MSTGTAIVGAFAATRGIPNQPGAGPPFSCAFALRGRIGPDGTAAIETGLPPDPERIAGTLRLTADSATFTLQADHGGCEMAWGSMERAPVVLPRTGDAGAAIDAAVLLRAVRLSAEPGATPAGRSLPALSVVAVLARRGAQVRLREPDTGRSGWAPAAAIVASDSLVPRSVRTQEPPR